MEERLPTEAQWLERRREVLAGAIRYVEEQEAELSRDSIDFLGWARHEVAFAEALLAQQRLLEQFQAFRASQPQVLAAA